jgi:fluoride exporter
MTLLLWTGAALIGGAGSVLRFLVDRRVQRSTSATWPVGTLAVNLVGAAILGLVDGHGVSDDVTLLAGTAAIGSFTTFSTWMYEVQRLGEERQFVAAATNLVVSLVLGLAVAAAGFAVGRWL